jgi:hypothetical protein
MDVSAAEETKYETSVMVAALLRMIWLQEGEIALQATMLSLACR